MPSKAPAVRACVIPGSDVSPRSTPNSPSLTTRGTPDAGGPPLADVPSFDQMLFPDPSTTANLKWPRPV